MTVEHEPREEESPKFLGELLEVRDRLKEAEAVIEHLARMLGLERTAKPACPGCDADLAPDIEQGGLVARCRGCGKVVEMSAAQVAHWLADLIRSAEEANHQAWDRYYPPWWVMRGGASAERFYLMAAQHGEPYLPWEPDQERLNDYELYTMLTCKSGGERCLLSLLPAGQNEKVAWLVPPERIGWSDLRPEQREFFGRWPDIARRFRGHSD